MQQEAVFLTDNQYDEVIANICDYFCCHPTQVKIIKNLGGGTNLVFLFECCNNFFVYRHPTSFSNAFIDRKRESIMQLCAKECGVDKTLIHIDAIHGWRISKYVIAHTLDTNSVEDINIAVALMRKLHNASVYVKWEFNVYELVLSLKEHFDYDGCLKQLDLAEYASIIEHLYQMSKSDGIKGCICHGDCRDANFLISEQKSSVLIDWEFSGYADPGFDIGSFIGGGDFNNSTIDLILKLYLGHTPTLKELRHFYALIAITSFAYLLLTEYYIFCGQGKEELTSLHPSRLRYTKTYSLRAFEMYNQ